MPTTGELIGWILVGLVAGVLAGRIVTWEKRGFGLIRNLGLGMAGAVVGGLLFRWLEILPTLATIGFTLRDVLAAVVGALIVLVALWIWRQMKPAPVAATPPPPSL